jgi:hypothetical protein
MPTALFLGKDASGQCAFAPKPSVNIENVYLGDGTAASFTVPSTADNWFVSFQKEDGVTIFVDFTGATAVLPDSGSFASGTAECNPGVRTLSAGTSVSVITPNTNAYLSCVMWQAGQNFLTE